jgi:predicted transcriptional regulator
MKLILSGKKQVEYRRKPPRRPISLVVLYESSPTKRIVGLAVAACVMCGAADQIWAETRKIGGIAKKEFDSYFRKSESVCVLKLGRVVKLSVSIPVSKIRRGFKIPQSYRYIDKKFIDRIYNENTT